MLFASAGCATQTLDADAGGGDNEAGTKDDVDVEPEAGGEDSGATEDTGEDTDLGVADSGPSPSDAASGMMDARGVDTGVVQSLDTGVVQPFDTGVVGPRDTGFAQANDTGTVGLPDTGTPPPVDTGVPPPVDSGPTGITCPVFPFDTRQCRGSGSRAPCCLSVAGLPTGCGCLVPLVNLCLPCT